MTTAQSIEFMVGISFCVLGLSYLLSTNAWAAWIEHLGESPARSALKIGGANLGAGIFVLGFHWIWQGAQMVTTIIGALTAFKGALHLLYPAWFSTKLRLFASSLRPALRLGGLVVFFLGAYILYDLFAQPGVRDYLCGPFSCARAVGP